MWHKCEQAYSHTRSIASNAAAAFICNGVWKKLKRKTCQNCRKKMKLRTHTPYFRLATDSQSILFHERHFSFSVWLCYFFSSARLPSRIVAFFAHIFLWLCSDVALTQTHARASNKHGCLALFRSMYRLFCLLILFLLACLFCISFPHTHLFRFLSLIWYRCAQKIHLFGVIKKKLFSHRLALSHTHSPRPLPLAVHRIRNRDCFERIRYMCDVCMLHIFCVIA